MIISTKNLGPGIKALREAAGLSQEHVAKTCGLDEKTVRRVESGGTFPSLRTLVKIVNACKKTDEVPNADQDVFLQIEA